MKSTHAFINEYTLNSYDNKLVTKKKYKYKQNKHKHVQTCRQINIIVIKCITFAQVSCKI